MVVLPAGKFMMGAPPTETGRDVQGSEDPPHEVTIGYFKPNAFGLYDMMGNVFEMTADCLYLTYLDAPADGSPRTTGDCQNRINRGGSWTSTPGGLRSAARGYDDVAMTRVVDLGFRLARGL